MRHPCGRLVRSGRLVCEDRRGMSPWTMVAMMVSPSRVARSKRASIRACRLDSFRARKARASSRATPNLFCACSLTEPGESGAAPHLYLENRWRAALHPGARG